MLLLVSVGPLLGTGCAARQAPVELVAARAAYERAHVGPAAEANTRGLHAARSVLEDAERQFAEDPSSEETRHLGYLAHRAALRADAEARTEIARAQRVQTEQAVAEIRARAKLDREDKDVEAEERGAAAQKARTAAPVNDE
jgi:hypothetical protein